MPYRNTRRKNNRTNRNKRNKRKSRKTQSGGSVLNHTGPAAFTDLTKYTISNTNKAAAVTYFENLLGDKVSNHPKIKEIIDGKDSNKLTTLKNQIINLYIKEITTVNFDDHLDKVIKKEDTLAKLNTLLGGDLCSSDDGSRSGGGIEAHRYEVKTPLEITGGTTEILIPLTTVAGASVEIKKLLGDTPPSGLDKLFPDNKEEIDEVTGVFTSGGNNKDAAKLITGLYKWQILNKTDGDITEKFKIEHLGGNKLGIKITPKIDSGDYESWLTELGDYSEAHIKGKQKPDLDSVDQINIKDEVANLKDDLMDKIKDKLKTIEIPLKITDSP